MKSSPKRQRLLSTNTVHIWYAKLDSKEYLLQSTKLECLLSEDELERAQDIHHETSKTHFIIGRAILRVILAHYIGVEPQEIRLQYNRNSKPLLDRGTIELGQIKFNLAHSHDFAIYALTLNNEIGVDLEYMHRPSQIEEELNSIAKRFFSEKENILLSKLSDLKKKREAFFKLWTAKEAYVKARGEAFAALVSLDQIDFTSVLRNKQGIFANRQKPEELFYFRQFEPAKDFMAAVVTEGSTPPKLLIRKVKNL